MIEDREAVEREERWSRGSAVGEAVWYRMCQTAGWDPKDPELQAQRGEVVETIRDAFAVMETEGLDGLSEWLELEGMV